MELLGRKGKNIFLTLIFIFTTFGCATTQISESGGEEVDHEAFVYFAEAENLVLEGEFEEAIVRYSKLIDSYPDLAATSRLGLAKVVETSTSAQFIGRRTRVRLIPREGSFVDLELELFWQGTIRAYMEVIARHSGTHQAALALYRIGLIYMEKVGDYGKAVEYFETITTSFQEDDLLSKAQFKLGEIYYRLFEFDRALKELIAIQLREPQSPLAEKSGQMVKFIRNLSNANRASLSLFIQGEEHYRRGSFGLAARFYGDALRRLSANQGEEELKLFAEELAYYASEAYYRAGDLERATGGFKGYLAQYPNGKFKSEASLRIADSSLAFKNHRLSAIKEYRNYLAAISDDRGADAYFKIGHAFREMDNLLEAAPNFIEANRRYQSNIDSYRKKITAINDKMSNGQVDEGQREGLGRQLDELGKQIEQDYILKGESGYQSGEAFFAAGEYEKALSQFQDVLRSYIYHVRFKESELRIAQIFYKLGRYQEAISAYLWVMVDFPQEAAAAEALFFSAKSYLWLGEVEKALFHFRRLTGSEISGSNKRASLEEIDFIAKNYIPEEEDAFKLYLDALDLYRRGSYWLALEGFRATSARYPQSRVHDDALLGEGNTLVGLGDTEKALGVYQEAIASSLEKGIKIESLLGMADIFAKDKIDLERASEIYRRLLQEYPEDFRLPIFHFKLASFFAEEGLYRQAIEEFEKALASYRQSSSKEEYDAEFPPQIQMALGDSYHGGGDFDRAGQEYEILVSDYPRSSLAPQALIKVGNNHLLAKRYDESIKTFESLISLYPESYLVPEAHYQKAKVYDLHLRKYKEAISEYRGLVELYPDSPLAPQAQYNIAFIYQFKIDGSDLEEEIKDKLILVD